MAGVEVIVEGTPVDPRSVAPTKEYRLKADKRHTQDGVAVKPGEVVHLTAVQAQAFADKFDAVDGSPFRVRSADEVKKDSEKRATASIPQPQVEHKDGQNPPPASNTPAKQDGPPAGPKPAGNHPTPGGTAGAPAVDSHGNKDSTPKP